MNKTKLIVLLLIGAIVSVLIWRYLNTYVYKPKAAPLTGIRFENEDGQEITDIGGALGGDDKSMYIRIAPPASDKISAFQITLKVDDGAAQKHFIIRNFGPVGCPVEPTSDCVEVVNDKNDYAVNYTWVLKAGKTQLPNSILIPIDFETTDVSGCGSISVTAANIYGPISNYRYDNPSLPITVKGVVGTGSCVPAPTRTPIPETTSTPTLTPTPIASTLVLPSCTDQVLSFADGPDYSTIVTNFDFDGRNTSSAKIWPSCVFRKIKNGSDPVTPAQAWISMSVDPASLTLITPRATEGRIFPGQTKGHYICTASVDSNATYEVRTSVTAWYDTSSPINQWNTGEDRTDTSCNPTLIIIVPPNPTRTPTPTLAAPVCKNQEVSNPEGTGSIRTSFEFEGKNTSLATVWPVCYYRDVTLEVPGPWLSMTKIGVTVVPPSTSNVFPGQSTGTLICQQSVTGGRTFEVKTSVAAWYDISPTDNKWNTGEERKDTSCTILTIESNSL